VTPMLIPTKDRYTWDELLGVMDRLLGEGGCPWDRQQTLESLRGYLLEETHEVLEAIDQGDPVHHREELGDLLFQIVFQSAIRKRSGQFDATDVVTGIAQKLVRRHPHVFGEVRVDSPAEVRDNWGKLKAEEAALTGQRRRTLAGVPRTLPGLLRAQRLQEKASGVGFDWSAPAGARDKVAEELGELDEAMAARDPSAVTHEVGDLLLAVVNLARLLDVDAEGALGAAVARFEDRFGYIEDRLEAAGRAPTGASLDELEALWQEAKQRLPKK
jgi:tetrapyrrole methylase family protein / MazG family protein